MNELHKYATFSVDLLGTPNKINSVFSMGRARIFYKGINRNRSIIDDEVAEQLASTIPGTPVIGTYNYETNDFEGHEENPSAFGFIPLDPHPTWVTENEKEYLEVDVVIWDGRFEEAQDILTKEKHLSMELNPRTMKGTFERKGSTTYYRITYAEFAGITVLGDDVEPCFEDARFITAFSNMVSAYALYIEETQRKIEGGNDVMDNINEIVEPEVTTDAVVEEVEVEAAEETEIVETVEAPEAVEFEASCGKEDKSKCECKEDKSKCEKDDKSKCEKDDKSKCEKDDKSKCECKDDKSKCEAEEETCKKCGKNPCVCESSLDIEDKEEADEEDDDKEECKEDYQALYAELSAKYESLETKYDEALNSLNKYTKKEKLEIINKFSTKLESEELIEKLTNEVDNYSLEEIKTELGHALVEQMSAEEDDAEETSTDANFSLNINIADNNLGNTAWDLVKRHKQGK